jgi:hypothetical protein
LICFVDFNPIWHGHFTLLALWTIKNKNYGIFVEDGYEQISNRAEIILISNFRSIYKEQNFYLKFAHTHLPQISHNFCS